MKVLVPMSITEARLQSSSIAEDEHPTWANGATYAQGDQVIRGHHVWVSVVNANTGHDPLTDVDATHWVDAGPTNQQAMFDRSPGTSSSALNEISLTLKPGVWVNAVGVLAAVCRTARLRQFDADGVTVLYDRTLVSTALVRSSWYGWFMRDRFTVTDDLIFDDLPRRVRGTLVLTLRGPGTVSLGVLTVGLIHPFGATLTDPESDLQDYSRVLIDDFGGVSVTRRGTSRKQRLSLRINNTDLPRVCALREHISSLPCVFIGTDSPQMRSALLAYGLATRMPIVVNGPLRSLCSLEVQGFA